MMVAILAFSSLLPFSSELAQSFRCKTARRIPAPSPSLAFRNVHLQSCVTPLKQRRSKNPRLRLVKAVEEETQVSQQQDDPAVGESLKEMNYGSEEGGSPVVALTRKHSSRRKVNSNKKKNRTESRDMRIDSVVVLEDLGSGYLEQVLMSSENPRPSESHCLNVH